MTCGRLLTFLPGMADTGVCDVCDLPEYKPFPDLPPLHSLENIERAPLETLDSLWWDLAFHVGMLDVKGREEPPHVVKAKLEKRLRQVGKVKATIIHQKRLAVAYVSGIAVMCFLTERELKSLEVFNDFEGPLGTCVFAPLKWPAPENIEKVSWLAQREVMVRLAGDAATAILYGESGDTQESEEIGTLIQLVIQHPRAAQAILKRLGERVRERLSEPRPRAALEVLALTLFGELNENRRDSILRTRTMSWRKAKKILRLAMAETKEGVTR